MKSLQEHDLAKAIVGLVQGALEPYNGFVARFGRGIRICAALPRAGSEPLTPSESGPAERPAPRRSGNRRSARQCRAVMVAFRAAQVRRP